MVDLLQTKIEFLKGVGPKRAELLNKELSIFTYQDMLDHFPFRYVDKSKVHKVNQICSDAVYYQLVGTVSNMQSFGSPRVTRITATFTDETGSVELVWFQGLKWIRSRFRPGMKYLIFGKANFFNNRYSFVHPEVDDYNPNDLVVGESLQGVYYTTQKLSNIGLGSRQIANIIKTLLPQVVDIIPEVLPQSLVIKDNLMSRKEAYYKIHLPSSARDIHNATLRLKYDEHFFFQLRMLLHKKDRQINTMSVVFDKVGDYFNTFYKEHLPFPLTGAQKRVIKEIRADLKTGHQMNRLLQGDVGSGKTIVALMIMLLALDNGYQAALMAPTEILATQHYESVTDQLKGMNINVALLTGSTKTAERRNILEQLADGSVNIIIGTHALIEDKVVFKNLGLCIVDEQHRFGVAQRARFWEKTSMPPHTLVMTATPIPRTLAMTQYGDLDVSKIDELPPGRKPVKTIHLYQESRLAIISFMKRQIAEGRQIYVVYPLIKESEKMDLINLKEGYEALLRDFPEPEYRICVVHGQMKADDKDFEMQRFVKHQAHIMVATTVIEVGVNVPNASVMIIENADRFGLSQLHQLRGRVGRGYDQSYCILVTDHKLTGEGKKRMATMVSTNDGFEIAEADLLLRGPGETQGTRQSGQVEMKLGDLTKDEPLIRHTRRMVSLLLESDPLLSKPEHAATKRYFDMYYSQDFDWGRIA
ncbi:MAG TPA: ATP-dependent DNA helicase RecG [Bacteroidetes bacterium]|nr:ATP-dependent DNA helicase RecG [Candidatus Limimorpha avicola]